jgi:PAS domain S-box-containing protein
MSAKDSGGSASKAEEALRHSEERYRLLFDSINDAVLVHELDADGLPGPFLEVNDIACQRLGYTRQELLRMSPRDIDAPEELALMPAIAARLLADKRVVWEGVHVSKDGRRTPVETSNHLVYLNGRPTVVATVRDIAERRRAEDSLRESEERFRQIFEKGPLGMAIVGSDSRFIRANAALCRMTGYTETELTSMEFRDISHPEHIVQDVEGVHRLRQGATSSYQAEKRYIRKDGDVIWGHLTATAIHDKHDQFLYFLAMVEDITARKRAEEELRRLMTAIEQVPESVVITDTHGRIFYVNPAFERASGYSHAEVVGKTPAILKSNKQDSAFYQELWTKINAGQVWQGRFVNRKKDGNLYTEDAVIAPVRDARGVTINFIAVKRDITRELEAEEQFRQAQKIDSIGRLAGGIAHDFNNILSVIIGHTGLALMELAPDAPVRAHIESIQDSADRAANLTRQMLAFARRQMIEPRVLDINELITNLNRMLRRLIGEDIQLVTDLAPAVSSIKADPGQLEQVLLNLVVNARDAMPEGGTLTLRTENVSLDAAYTSRHLNLVPGDYVKVSVRDTGTGIPDDAREHIFEPFFTTKEQGKGTGMGLATCFGIVKQSNGHICFESKPDQGTTFEVYLPQTPGDLTPSGDQPAAPNLPRGSETILIVEDELSLRGLITRALRAHGYTVLEAANGQEALPLAEAHRSNIQLLVTDVVMPGMSGQTLAERVIKICPGVKIIFISGYISNPMVRDAIRRIGSHFLQKPFSLSELGRAVREALDERVKSGKSVRA